MADRYWVGWTGNWSDRTNHWSASSGGSPWATLPTADDNVYFNSSSSSNSYTVTLNSTAACKDMIWTNPASGSPTFGGGSYYLYVYGSVSFVSGMTITADSTLYLTSYSSSTVTMNGNTWGGNVVFWSWPYQLNDNFAMKWATLTLEGSFRANSKDFTISNGVSIIGSFTGSNSFYNLTVNGWVGNTVSLLVNSDLTATGALSINGYSSTERLLVKSNTAWTRRTLTAATVSCSNVDFLDITGSWAWSWDLSSITWWSWNCWNNSGITFTTWVDTNWQSWTTWSTATWSVRLPLPQDTATFTTAGTATITQDMPRIGSVDFTGSSNKTWATTTACSVFWSINLTNLATLSGNSRYTLEGRWNHTITTAGKTWGKSIDIKCVDGTYTIQDDLIWDSSYGITFYTGTFTATSQNISYGNIRTGTGTKIINMGSGTWTQNYNAFSFSATGLTLNPGTSTLKLADNSWYDVDVQLGGLTWNNVWVAKTGAGTLTIQGSNVFNDFKINPGRTVKFTAGTTQTVKTFTATWTAGNLITLDSTTTGTFALAKSGGGVISCDYLNIQHCVASPSSTWYAGVNSTNNQWVSTAGSGWYFTLAPLVLNLVDSIITAWSLIRGAGKKITNSVTLVWLAKKKPIKSLSQTVSVIGVWTKKQIKTLKDAITTNWLAKKYPRKRITNVVSIVAVGKKKAILSRRDTISLTEKIIRKGIKDIRNSVIISTSWLRKIYRAITNVIGVSSSFWYTLAIIKNITESLRIGHESLRTIGKKCMEFLLITPLFSRVATLHRILSQILPISSTSFKQQRKTVQETISIAVSVIRSTAHKIRESISLVLSFTRIAVLKRSCTENISLLQGFLKARLKTISQALSVVDGIKKRTAKSFLQTIILADLFPKSLSRVLTKETIIVSGAYLRKFIRSIANTISVSWTFAARFVGIMLREAFSVSETFTRSIFRNIMEAIAVVDRIARGFFFRALEAISIADTIKKIPMKLLSDIIALNRSFSMKLNGILLDLWSKSKRNLTDSWTRASKTLSDTWKRTPKN